MKFSKAQQTAWDSIQNHIIETPDKVWNSVFSPPYDYTDTYESGNSHTWYANRVYGVFNTATIKCLEKKGLIKIHKIGGSYMTDEIEIL